MLKSKDKWLLANVCGALQDISIEQITFDKTYCKNDLLPSLTYFYDNWLAPEIVSPVQPLGLLLRNLKTMVWCYLFTFIEKHIHSIINKSSHQNNHRSNCLLVEVVEKLKPFESLIAMHTRR